MSAVGWRYGWPGALFEGTLVRRYHRFLADVRLADGREVTAHCVNPGRMEGLVERGARVWVTHEQNAKRKLQFTWQVIAREGGLWVGTNTVLPNAVVGAMLQARVLPGFEDHLSFRAEVSYGESSRIDFAVETDEGVHWIEVKNIHLVYPDGGAYFPDSVSERGSKHLRELTELAERGQRCTVQFVVQRGDARFVRPSDVHDPVFARAAREAARAGVHFRASVFDVDAQGLRCRGEVPVDLGVYGLEAPRAWMEALRATSGWERPKKAVVEGAVEAEAAVVAVKKVKRATAEKRPVKAAKAKR
ncbi:MAG: DNA/RNA nuclease SfsA [Deltaproteobacteria bacterium]|nr:DNA/RNA nuclease SfsA [Deltaproteobacteria bacterium]